MNKGSIIVGKRKELIFGPTRTGKSEQLLDRIELLWRENKKFILLLPTGDHVNHYKLQIALKHDGIFGSSIVDLNGLVNMIERVTDAPLPKKTPKFVLTHMLENIVGDRLSKGELIYFRKAAELKSFASELRSLIDEFIQSRVTPEDLTGLDLGRSQELKLSEIRLLYSDYLESCALQSKGNKYQRLGFAIDILKSDKNILKDFDTLIVDGFYDYTPLQSHLFKTLFERIGNVLTAQLYEEGRGEVFDYTKRNEKLFENFEQIAPKLGKWDSSPIAGIREKIFDSNNNISDKPKKGIPLKIIVESGTRKLVEEIARRVKYELIKNKTAPSRIGIMYRSGEEYPDLIKRVFPRFGIPITVQHQRGLVENPVVALFMKILKLNPERNFGFELRSILRSKLLNIVINSEQFDADSAVNLLRAAGANDGKRECLKRLEAHHKDSKTEYGFSESNDAEMQRSVFQIREIFEKFSHPEGTNNPEIFKKHIGALLEFSGIQREVENDPINKNALNLMLAQADNVTDQFEERELSFSDYRKILIEAVGEQKMRSDFNLSGGVEIVDVENARWRRYDTLFICGLIDGAFPETARSVRLIDRGIREKVDDRINSSLNRTVESIQEEERLLYYISLSRADEKIYLCYPSVDSDGGEIIRSNFVDRTEETYRMLTDEECIPTFYGDIKKFRNDQLPFTSEDELLRAMAQDYAPKFGNESDFQLKQSYKMMKEAGIRQSRKLPAYSGLIEEPSASATLTELLEGKSVWSATELERYGKCPFLFLIEKLFRLEKSEEFLEQISPLERGSFYHEVLKIFYEAQIAKPLSIDGAEYKNLLAKIITDVSKNPDYRRHNIAPILWEIELTEVEENLLRYIETDLQPSESELSSLAVEVGFGAADKSFESSYSTDRPLIIENDGIRVSLKGRIDRIDSNKSRSEFSVIDYKSGGIPDRKSIQDGINLQLPIYLEAVRQLILDKHQSQPRTGYYYSLKSSRKLLIFENDKGINWDDAFKPTKDYIIEYVNNIGRGRFPVEPKDCRKPCDFADLCRQNSD